MAKTNTNSKTPNNKSNEKGKGTFDKMANGQSAVVTSTPVGKKFTVADLKKYLENISDDTVVRINGQTGSISHDPAYGDINFVIPEKDWEDRAKDTVGIDMASKNQATSVVVDEDLICNARFICMMKTKYTASKGIRIEYNNHGFSDEETDLFWDSLNEIVATSKYPFDTILSIYANLAFSDPGECKIDKSVYDELLRIYGYINIKMDAFYEKKHSEEDEEDDGTTCQGICHEDDDDDDDYDDYDDDDEDDEDDDDEDEDDEDLEEDDPFFIPCDACGECGGMHDKYEDDVLSTLRGYDVKIKFYYDGTKAEDGVYRDRRGHECLNKNLCAQYLMGRIVPDEAESASVEFNAFSPIIVKYGMRANRGIRAFFTNH